MPLDILLNNGLLHLTLVWSLLSIVFLVASAQRDNSIMDIVYGPTFAITGIALLLINERTDLASIAVISLVSLWALRLGVRIGRKNYGRPEDERYGAWRTVWMQRGTTYFLLRSYIQIYLLQGTVISLVSLPIILAITFPHELLTPWLWVGVGIALFGLLYESIADWQLDRFLARKRAGTESAVLMTTGLFAYSRRPNYFGETLVWWGLAIAVAPVSYGWLAFVSPLVITYIVTRITGPMLEAVFLDRYPTEYQAYMDRTSYMIPRLKKSSV